MFNLQIYLYLYILRSKILREISEKTEIIRVSNIVAIARYRHGEIQIFLRE